VAASRIDVATIRVDPGEVGDDQQRGGRFDPVSKLLRLPWSTRDFIDRIVSGSVNQTGRRTLYLLITTWDMAGGGPFAASAVASSGIAKTVDIVEKSLTVPILNPLLKKLGADNVKLRASLCASQLVGIGIMRYAVRSEPIHSMDVDTLVDALAPTMQRYLTGDLS
jgi:Tetracyclin repressor-like, C-terminal domain